MVMGFQNYSSLPRHLRGMLGLSPELDTATYSGTSRTQVCIVVRIRIWQILCISWIICLEMLIADKMQECPRSCKHIARAASIAAGLLMTPVDGVGGASVILSW